MEVFDGDFLSGAKRRRVTHGMIEVAIGDEALPFPPSNLLKRTRE